MTNSTLKSAVEAVLELAEEDQVQAIEILQTVLDQREAGLQLSAEQIAEVMRRLADPNPEYATDEEVEEFFTRGLHED